MKILRITIKNINSLKGLHRLDFTKEPLSGAALFAVTGDTGAGKTTILDALTLALYGEVSRDCAAEEMMTHGTAELLAEAEFEIKGEAYRAVFSLERAHKKADGKVKSAKRYLIHLTDNERIIAEKTKDVKEKIKELTGLDFRQFRRSVLLAQGDFAAFLKADKNERAQLLERVTDAEIYSQISKAAYQRAKSETGIYEHKLTELQAVRTLNSEEAEALKEEISGNKKSIELINEELKNINFKLKLAEDWQKSENERKESEKLVFSAKDALSRFAPEIEKLNRHREAIKHRPNIHFLRSKEAEIKEKKGVSEQTSAELKNLIVQEKTAEESAQKTQQNYLELQAAYEQKEPVFREAFRLENLLTDGRKQLEILRADYRKKEAERKEKEAESERLNELFAEKEEQIEQDETRISEWEERGYFLSESADIQSLAEKRIYLLNALKKLEKDYAGQQKAIDDKQILLAENQREAEKCERQISETEGQIKAIKNTLFSLAGGKSREALATEIEEAEKLKITAEKITEKQKDSAEFQSEIDRQTETLRRSEQLIIDLKEKAAKTVEESELLAEKSALVEAQLALERERKALQDYREALQADKPCPLCGSLHHPFASEPIPKVSETEKKAADFQRQIMENERLKTEIKEQFGFQKEQKSTAEKLLSDWSLKQKNISEYIENQFIILGTDAQNFPAYLQKQAEKIESLRLLHKKISEAEKSETALQQTLSDYKHRLDLLRQSLENSRAFISEKKQNCKELSLETEGFKTELSVLNEKLIEFLPGKILCVDSEAEKELDEYRKIIINLSSIGEGVKNLRNELIELDKKAGEAKNSFDFATKESEQKLKEGSALKTKNESYLADLKQITAELSAGEFQEKFKTELKKSRDRAEAEGEKLQTLRRQISGLSASSETLEKQILLLEKEIFGLKTELEQAIQLSGFSGIDQVNALLLPDEKVKETEDEQKKLENNYSAFKARLEQNTEKVQNIFLQITFEEKAEDLKIILQNTEEKRSELLTKTGASEAQFSAYLSAEKRIQGLRNELEKAQKRAGKWNKLKELIGSADGDKFRVFAQFLTLSRLIELANRHLKKLNKRYQIAAGDSEKLDIEIIDTYQADNNRSAGTLSGGESFLVSLALALGLSDLASQRADIRSLFIDEGFGTLDAQALEMAAAALDSLQASGKTVGVISHVEALKERIRNRIHVKKVSGGFSVIEVF